jgi:hypothetical protein
MTVAVCVDLAYAIVSNPDPQDHVGLCPHYGFLGLLWRANAQYIIRRRHFRLVRYPPHRRTLQAVFLQHLAREHNRAACTPRHNHDIRSHERLFPLSQVGRVSHLLLRCNHDRERRGGMLGLD